MSESKLYYRVRSAECRVRSAECRVQSAEKQFCTKGRIILLSQSMVLQSRENLESVRKKGLLSVQSAEEDRARLIHSSRVARRAKTIAQGGPQTTASH